MYHRLKLLLLGNDDARNEALIRLLMNYTNITCVQHSDELFRLLATGNYDAVLCEWRIENGNWHDIVNRLEERFPGLPTVVVSHSGDERKWVEVLAGGGFDLMAPPYTEQQIVTLLNRLLWSQGVTCAA